MKNPSGDDSKPFEPVHYCDDYISFDDYIALTPEEMAARVPSEDEKRETEIQTRMYLEARRAVKEEIEWLEEHNFPIWILFNDEIVDLRTLSPEERASIPDKVQDLSKPEMILRPMTEAEKAERDRKKLLED